MSTAFTGAELRPLLQHRGAGSVSMFAPLHRGGPETRQDPIRLKNLLQQAEKQLVDLGFRRSEAAGRLDLVRPDFEAPASARRDEAASLAAFVADAQPVVYHLPMTVAPVAVVGRRYHVKPLLPLVDEAREVYVLALSQNSVRLLEADRYGAREMELPDTPRSFAELAAFDQRERHVEFHTETAAPGPNGGRPAMFHGQGVGSDEAVEKKRLLEYCHRINAGVCRAVGTRRRPLLLAAAEPLPGLYRRANTYPYLSEEVIAGNPDESDVRGLQAEAAKLLAAEFDRRLADAAARYRQAAGKGQGSTDLGDVLRAAHIDRIDTAFVALDEHRWGRFDVDEGRMEVHPSQQPGDEDLLDLAAARAALGGGTVHVVPRERMPEDAPVAVSYRFALPGGAAGAT